MSNRLPQLALALGILILGLKLAAYGVTGSVALLSDALESVVNVVAALGSLIAIRVAARPPDASHPFGHSKIEYLSAVLEGILVIVAALLIGQQAWVKFRQPSELSSLGLAAFLAIIATALNAGLASALVRFGRRERSPALLADGLHLWTDVITTIGVLSGVFLAWLTDWWWLDPLLALAVALNIFWMGGRLLRESVGGLLDESLASGDLKALERVIETAMGEALEVHDLRTRKAGRQTFVTFHLVVPGSIPVSKAHDICDELETVIKKALPGAFTTIHIEPHEKAHYEGYTVVSSTLTPRQEK